MARLLGQTMICRPPRITRIGTQTFLRTEVQIPLDRQTEPPSHGRQLLRLTQPSSGIHRDRALGQPAAGLGL